MTTDEERAERYDAYKDAIRSIGCYDRKNDDMKLSYLFYGALLSAGMYIGDIDEIVDGGIGGMTNWLMDVWETRAVEKDERLACAFDVICRFIGGKYREEYDRIEREKKAVRE